MISTWGQLWSLWRHLQVPFGKSTKRLKMDESWQFTDYLPIRHGDVQVLSATILSSQKINLYLLVHMSTWNSLYALLVLYEINSVHPSTWPTSHPNTSPSLSIDIRLPYPISMQTCKKRREWRRATNVVFSMVRKCTSLAFKSIMLSSPMCYASVHDHSTA